MKIGLFGTIPNLNCFHGDLEKQQGLDSKLIGPNL